ncbi:MAG TPA: isocitrate/isopropylmalate family dehydrogenase, partial [Arenimonas sp.]|nr:isocitrate/isopropylmalate family dehydrogenase [Arenimonas sp.]
NIPGLAMYGGSIAHGTLDGQSITVQEVFEAVGAHGAGKISDEAAVLAGSLGLLPSASLGVGSRGLYEPIHGSAPDIAGKSFANPIGCILSAAMMLRHSFGLEREAADLEAAVAEVIAHAELTRDLSGTASTQQITQAVIAALHQLQQTKAA